MIVGPGELLHAGRVVDVERLGPRLAAVGRAEDTACLALLVDVPLRREQHEVGILRVDEDGGDLLRIVEPEVPPGFSGVGRLIDAVAFVDAAAGVRKAARATNSSERPGSRRAKDVRLNMSQLSSWGCGGTEIIRVRRRGR